MQQKLHTVIVMGIVGLAAVAVGPVWSADANAPAASVEAAKTPAEVAAEKERFTAEVTNSKDLPNFHEVHPFLYRGGAPTEVGLQRAKDLGIRTIIDLRGGDKKVDEIEWSKHLGLNYVNLPMSSEAPTKAQLKTFEDLVSEAQKDPKKGAVLVHCAHGSDRTGCLIGVWRVKHDGYSYDEAYKEMRHYWFGPKFTKLSGAVREAAAK